MPNTVRRSWWRVLHPCMPATVHRQVSPPVHLPCADAGTGATVEGMKLLALAVVLGLSGCGGGSTCDASNCSGCCSPAGTCVAGTTADACGHGGTVCGACGAGSECFERACRVKCVCLDGCCGADGGCVTKRDNTEVFSSAFCPSHASSYCAPCDAPKVCQGYQNTGTVTRYACQ